MKGECRKMTHQQMRDNAQLGPMVSMKMDENRVEFALRYVVAYKKRRITKNTICVNLLKAIEASEGRIQLGAPSFELSSVPTLDVTVRMK